MLGHADEAFVVHVHEHRQHLARNRRASTLTCTRRRVNGFSRRKLLGGNSPAELIRSGRIDDVMRLIGQLRDAVHL
jgi:hypothetical protein